VKAVDQFHAGIVTDDLDTTIAELTDQFGYEWAPEIALPNPVSLPDRDVVLDLRFRYSVTTPRLEIIQTIPGTMWRPAEGSGIHHLGYWSDDVPADCAALEARGYTREAAGKQDDGSIYWAYLRRGDGPRIELVSRALEEGLSQLWSAP
jgi:hypothetical protein